MAAPAQYSSSDEELPESFQPARTPRVQEDKSNPDLYYRLKLKLWNRDRITDCIRSAHVPEPDPSEDCAHWAIGTRVVISDENDHYTGKVGRIVEYRGKDWYAIITEDGHKVCYSPLQFHRCADQRGPKKGTGNHLGVDLQAAIMGSGPALKREASPRTEPKDSSSASQAAASPRPPRDGGGARGAVAIGGVGAGGGGSQSHLPTGTRVRIVRQYGGGALAKEDVKTGTTTTFTHGWYYIQLDDSGKQTSYRRHSFVVIGDEEDVALGYSAEEEEERRRRDREQRREREEAERQREEDERRRAEAEMTQRAQEDRDALEAARLAAMLNRNPRRRGGPDPAPTMHLPVSTKPAPVKSKGAGKPAKGAHEGSGKKAAGAGGGKDGSGKSGKKGKEDGEKGASISAQDIFGDEDED